MRTGLLAIPMVAVFGLVAAGCDPNNQPPNAPKFRIAEYDSVSFTGVFTNNCKDPDKKPDPPRKCQQWVTGTTKSMPRRISCT